MSGLVEETHFVFFKKNIVGVAFNFYGPRISRLSRYFEIKASTVGPLVHFEPLLRSDIQKQLDSLQDVRLFQLRIRPSWASTLANANEDLAATFEAASRVGSPEEVEVILRPRKYSRMPLAKGLLDTIRRIAAIPRLREEASAFIVRGMKEDTRHVETIDILSDQFVSTREIVLLGAKSRAVKKTSAYQAIETAHAALGPQLRLAASVEVA
jgi:hypothetical protein